MTDQSAYEQFAQSMLQGDSVYIPKILRCMVDEAQAKLLVSLPGTVAEMAEKMGRSEVEVDADLKDMFRKGLTFKKIKEGAPIKWRAPSHIAQFHDATIVWPEATEEFLENWRLYMENEWPGLAPLIAGFLPKPITRVIPIGKSIETGKMEILAPDSIRQIVESSTRVAVTKCTCRLTMHKCDAPIEVCLQINRGADYTIDRGSGREVTKDEAFEIIEQCQKVGLVHVTMNKHDAGHFICNCCGCCCQAFSQLISDGVKLCDPSRYQPSVSLDECTACGDCSNRCLFGAIEVKDGIGSAINSEKCMGCGQCAIVCDSNAITMHAVKTPAFIPA
ncbi:MAG: 4Fe-4S ferredoxin [Deltaproteobacteria bacterium]|nr:4Fe-4S ferredoxin [Deltaproteobacteria bacterium]